MNRGEIYAAVTAELNRPDKAAFYPQWLASAFFRINQLMRVEEMVKRVYHPIAERLVTLPKDYLEMKTISLRSVIDNNTLAIGDNAGGLRYYTPEALADGNLVLPPPVQRPTWYTIRGRQIELGVWTDNGQGYQLDLVYYGELPELLADGDTNWLATKAPHIIINAMLHFGFNNLKEYDTATQLMSSVATEIDVMNGNAEKQKVGTGPLVPSPTRKMGGRRS